MLVSDIIDQSVIYQEVFFHLKDYLVLPLSYRYAWIETPGPQSSLTDCIYLHLILDTEAPHFRKLCYCGYAK